MQDKITQCISFLQEYGEIEDNLSLREVYDKYLHPDILDIEDKRVWRNIQEGNILNVFQFDSEVGSQAAKKIRPTSMLELSDANGLMRLMTAEKGAETPMEKYIRFKNDLNQWYDEMKTYGLTKEEMSVLEPYFKSSYGVPPSQEQMMLMLMDENICGFTLAEANAARKIVGKKLMSKIPELKEKVLTQAKSKTLGEYVWKCGIGPQMGYSFSIIHALAYSFIGYQTAYLATKWNPIYWDTSCLIVNSSSIEQDEEEDTDTKDKGTNYAKIAKAIGEIISSGIEVSLVNINTSDLGFKPDIENNRILYGLKALSNINEEIIEMIKAGRPYKGVKDFMNRCPIKKTAMLSLIKAGAFDEIETQLNGRKEIMIYYISRISEPKQKLNLLNFSALIQRNLVPKEYELQIRVFNFTKYLKTRRTGSLFSLDAPSMQFLEKFLPDTLNLVTTIDNKFFIEQKAWGKVYQSIMDVAREWLRTDTNILRSYNNSLFLELWEKYASGTLSHWEMESLCFYHGDHELKNVNFFKYNIVNFNDLQSCEVDYFYKKTIPIYKLYRIAGTVIAKDDNRSSISLLTTTGVVTVKFTREYYSMFKKQISQVQSDGTKKVIERSWFKRGTMLMITGYRRDDQFIGKTYAATQSHELYKITDVIDSDIKLQNERATVENSFEEDYNEQEAV